MRALKLTLFIAISAAIQIFSNCLTSAGGPLKQPSDGKDGSHDGGGIELNEASDFIGSSDHSNSISQSTIKSGGNLDEDCQNDSEEPLEAAHESSSWSLDIDATHGNQIDANYIDDSSNEKLELQRQQSSEHLDHNQDGLQEFMAKLVDFMNNYKHQSKENHYESPGQDEADNCRENMAYELVDHGIWFGRPSSSADVSAQKHGIASKDNQQPIIDPKSSFTIKSSRGKPHDKQADLETKRTYLEQNFHLKSTPASVNKAVVSIDRPIEQSPVVIEAKTRGRIGQLVTNNTGGSLVDSQLDFKRLEVEAGTDQRQTTQISQQPLDPYTGSPPDNLSQQLELKEQDYSKMQASIGTELNNESPQANRVRMSLLAAANFARNLRLRQQTENDAATPMSNQTLIGSEPPVTIPPPVGSVWGF